MNEKHELILQSHSEHQTFEIGEALGECLEPGDIIGLTGDLGAGKTTLVRGIARGAGLPPTSPVTSPTFTIMNIYDGKKCQICHLDLYRMEADSELIAVEWDERLSNGSVIVVEWIERFSQVFPSDILRISINISGENSRIFRFFPSGELSSELVDELNRSASIRKLQRIADGNQRPTQK